ncbi:MAG: SHOCT domain-containing protein [Patescibacteria group bacterium]|jgi:hypothetical protein
MNESIEEFRGYNGTLILTDVGVVIKRGVKGFLLGGMMLRGEKTIPYSSIVAVQLKKAGMTAGYLQLTLVGGSEAKSGLFQSATDENSINFHITNNNNERSAKVRELIEARIAQIRGGGSAVSGVDELAKYADLRDKGVLTEVEFQAKKKQILER